MKTHPFLRSALLLLVAAAGSGCLQMEQATLLNPDGSGKLNFKVAFSKSLMSMVKMGAAMGEGADDIDPSDPSEIVQKFVGVVAWSEVRQAEEDDWIRISMTGWFEDINKLKIYKDNVGEGDPQVEFAFAKTEKGYTLISSDNSAREFTKMGPGAGEDGDDDEDDDEEEDDKDDEDGDKKTDEMARQMMAMMKPMFKGMRLATTVTVPGPIVEATGFQKTEGRTVSMEIKDKDIFDLMDGKAEAVERFKGVSSARKISWTETAVTADEQAAFKKELEQARADWARIQEEWKKKAAEKKAKEEEKIPVNPGKTEE